MIYLLMLYIVPDQQYDMYHDTLQPILDTYNDTNFTIFYREYTKIVPILMKVSHF